MTFGAIADARAMSKPLDFFPVAGEVGGASISILDCREWPPPFDEDPDRKVGDGP
jgi:hypothetical protein